MKVGKVVLAMPAAMFVGIRINSTRTPKMACVKKSKKHAGHNLTMAVFNPITGAKRRRPRRYLPRKKRSLASSPASEMLSVEALEAFEIFMAGARLHLAFLSLLAVSGLDISNLEMSRLCSLLLLGGSYLFSSAMEMLLLDSALMDLSEEEIEGAGYRKELVGITLDSFENDDDCEDKTQFTKAGIQSLLSHLPLGEFTSALRCLLVT